METWREWNGVEKCFAVAITALSGAGLILIAVDVVVMVL